MATGSPRPVVDNVPHRYQIAAFSGSTVGTRICEGDRSSLAATLGLRVAAPVVEPRGAGLLWRTAWKECQI